MYIVHVRTFAFVDYEQAVTKSTHLFQLVGIKARLFQLTLNINLGAHDARGSPQLVEELQAAYLNR